MQKVGKYRLDHILCALLLGSMVSIAFANIVGRYLFNYSISFTEEVTINMFVCLVVVGSGIAFERGSHLGMVSLFKILPARAKESVVVLNAILGALLFLVLDILLVRTIYFEMTLFKAKSPALGMPIWIYYLGVILVTPFVFMGIFRGARRSLTELKG